ncbi:thioredoxin-like protein [Lasiosphaeris hirsuta]|uniref:Thioredoxin-like protein n=1 Tax=Lasiosphaeris hirsuta TaxID=260670 RepID=A0AA40ART7_9PEZI|nr:thioredoxin-like protein [Lasiosphaeris hirsuta]
MVYHLHITSKNYSSWSMRPWLLMRELGIPFDEHSAELISGSYRQPHWKAFSPLAHVPCLHDIGSDAASPDPPLVLWESIAIVEHLAEAHPDKHVYPAARAARAWARSATAEMHAGFAAMREEMGMNIGLRVDLEREGISEALAKDLRRVDELWEEGLARFGGPWLAGTELTAVDAFFAPVVLRTQTYVGAEEWLGERARGYVRRMLEVEGVKEWVKQALAEVGRETLHDEDSIRGRKLLADLRATEK